MATLSSILASKVPYSYSILQRDHSGGRNTSQKNLKWIHSISMKVTSQFSHAAADHRWRSRAYLNLQYKPGHTAQIWWDKHFWLTNCRCFLYAIHHWRPSLRRKTAESLPFLYISWRNTLAPKTHAPSRAVNQISSQTLSLVCCPNLPDNLQGFTVLHLQEHICQIKFILKSQCHGERGRPITVFIVVVTNIFRDHHCLYFDDFMIISWKAVTSDKDFLIVLN